MEDGKHVKIVSVHEKEDRKRRPTGLNTVEMLKVASSALNIGPHHAMQVERPTFSSPRSFSTLPSVRKNKLGFTYRSKELLAFKEGTFNTVGVIGMNWWQVAERLYTQGYLSYPRTESSAYPPNFDFRGILSAQIRHPIWGQYASSILERGFSPSKVHMPHFYLIVF